MLKNIIQYRGSANILVVVSCLHFFLFPRVFTKEITVPYLYLNGGKLEQVYWAKDLVVACITIIYSFYYLCLVSNGYLLQSSINIRMFLIFNFLFLE